MAQAINVPVNVQAQNTRQLTQELQTAINRVRLNLGNGKALSSLSQPLGRLTGQADEFSKSLDAANARVLAFGASVGIVNAFSNAFKNLVASTIEVEKAIKAITVVGDQFNGKTKELTQGLFNVAKTTGQSFAEVSKAALEFSRQGLGVEQTLQRTKDALILTRLTGLDAAKAVEGLTAAANGFTKAGLSTTQILNKLAAVDQAFAVSSADLIEGFNRSAAVAENAGVTFDELAGIITALQQKTSRGGAVIGNALKTIFTRLQDTNTLNQLQGLGIAVQDLQGNLLPARQILQNLAKDVQGLGQITKAGIFKDVAGAFQINQLISLVDDLNNKNSIATEATKKSAGATNEAFLANEKLSQSLDAIINKVGLTGKQLGSLIGELGLSDSFKGILDGINSFLEGATNLLQGDDLGSKFAKGIVKGIGAVLTGPGLGIFLAVIGKLTLDLVKFGTQSIKTFFGIGQAAKQQQQVQESIVQTLLRNENVLRSILNTQGGQNAQAQTFLRILNQQEQALQNIRSLAGGLAAPVIAGGYGIGPQGGLQRTRGAAGGYLPAQEASDVRRGVGGASPSSKVVAIPNFAFGGGKRGTMIANTSEYIVPNYAGGGSAIFNQDMVKTMGLPAGAKKISAAGGFVPNFKELKPIRDRVELAKLRGFNPEEFNILYGKSFGFPKKSSETAKQYENIALRKLNYIPSNRNLSYKTSSSIDGYRFKGDILELAEVKADEKSGLQSWDKQSIEDKFLRGIAENYNKNSRNQLSVGLKKTKTIVGNLIAPPQILRKKGIAAENITRSSNGYIPNFAFTNDQLGVLGLYGPNTPINGSQVYTFESNRPQFFKDIKSIYQKRVTGIVNSYARQIAGKIGNGFQISPKAVTKSLDSTDRISGFIFEDVMNQLAGPNFDTNRVSGNVRIDFPMTSNLREVFGVTGVERFAEVKLTPQEQVSSIIEKQEALARALATGGYTPKETDPERIERLKAEAIAIKFGEAGRPDPRLSTRKKAFLQEMRSSILTQNYTKASNESAAIKKALGLASTGYIPNFASSDFNGNGRVDPSDGIFARLRNTAKKYAPTASPIIEQVLQNLLGLPEGVEVMKTVEACVQAMTVLKEEDKINEKLRKIASEKRQIKRREFLSSRSSSGFIPSFAASALQQAIAREKSAGLSSSQIYIDQSPALKSPSNPMGLMVANTRDEPAGGFQGIARARKEGANPKLYGAANGFVPNYASQQTGSLTPNAQKVEKGFGDIAGKLIIFQSALAFFESGFTEAGSATNKVTEGLQTLVTAVFAYQAIQQLTNKNENKQSNQIVQNTSRLKKFGESLKKFADDFAKGGGGRARIVSMGGRLPSNTPLGTRLSASLGTSRFAEVVRGAVGDPIGALKSLGGVAAAAAIALKSFNDIAALFYTRSSKLDSSLELLSSSAGKASASLNDIDRANLKGATSAFKNIGIREITSKFLSGFNPFNLGKQQVSFNTGNSSVRRMLKGGQTEEDFIKAQEDLSSLIFSNLKTKLKDASPENLKNETQSSVIELFNEATDSVTNVLDLEKLFNLPAVQELVKNASDTNKKIDRITAAAESQKAFPKLVASVEEIIAGTNTLFNNEINKINDFSEKIKAIQASKAFGNLNLEQQLSVNLQASTKEFENSFKQRQIDIIKNAQELIKSNLPDIVEGENFNIGPELQTRLQNATNLDEVVNILKVFQKELGTIDPTKIKSFVSQLNDFQNSVSTFKSNLETRSATLKLEQEELIATTKAQIEFRDKFIDFSNSVGDAQRSLINLRGALERIDVQTQSRIDIRSAFATSRQQQLDIIKEETLSGLSDKQSTEATINLQEALIEARKQSFTEENLIALNSNTQAIKDLNASIIETELNDVQALFDKALNYLEGERKPGDTLTKEQLIEIVRDTAVSAIPGSPKFKDVLDPLRNKLNILQGSGIQSSNVSAGIERVFAPNSSIGNFAQSSKTLQEFISKTAEEFGLNEQVVLRIRPQLLNIYDSVKGQATTASEALATEKAKLKANQDLLDATNNYGKSIGATLLDLETRLATEPMSAGQFASSQRSYRIAQEEERRRQTGGDAAVREYRSSFGRGFEEALGPIEEKTLDFKNELGREIPQLFSQNLAQGLNDAISGAKSLKDALRDAATSFLNAITQKNIENLANLFTSGVGSFFTKKASGGMINGGSGTKDDVPAMLMGGEYVIKKSAVKKYGSKFLDSLNNGGIKAFAKGGGVQSGRGGFYVPGDYGEGAITGKNQLLAFAGQSFTGGQYDQVGVSGMSGASINLESESARLTAFGRENSPMFERVQQAKEEAFNVYLNQLKQEQQYREQLKQIEEAEKARKKQLTTAIVSAVATTALSYAGKAFGTGSENAVAEAGAQAGEPLTFMQKLTTGFIGGLKNLGAAILPGGAKPTFELNDYAKANRFMNSVGFNNNFKPDYSGGTFRTGSYEYNPSQKGFGRVGKASGGMVTGGSGIRDDVPAMLTGGEFVLNNRATRKLGVENLNRLNSGDVGGNSGASGQQVSESIISKLDELIQTTRESSKENVVVNVNGMEASEKRADENKSANDRELQRKIRDAVLAVLAQEKRMGGSLSK